MKTHIFGATGLIGSALARQVNLCDLADADYVVFAAGYGQPAKFMAEPLRTIEVNTAGLLGLINGMKPGARLLYLSSSEVYSGSPRYTHTEDDIGTTTPSHPRASYIEAKRCGEAICNAAREKGRDIVITRVALAYGPGFKPDDQRVLNQFISMAVDQGHVSPRDGGPARRCYLYMDDCVDMLLNILRSGKHALYNVGGVQEVSIANLAKRIAEISGASYRLPRNTGCSGQGAPNHVKLDLSRYFREFGEREFVSIDEGLKRTIAWYRQTYGSLEPFRASA